MTTEPILLVGAGGHARACIDVIEQEGRFLVGALLGLPSEIGTDVLGYGVVGTDTDIKEALRAHRVALVTVGQIKTPELRMRLFADIERWGAETPTIVSPRAYVSRHARIGPGTIVMHGAVVNAGAIVGRNCIVNSQALVEHDVVIADHCHIATAASVNSGVSIGAGTFIGSNASVRQGSRIGARCVIGMGHRVLADCADGVRVPPWGGAK
jgi:sugar O-acyltransferase (sialic acid O-acetyltransferase NeuD family)